MKLYRSLAMNAVGEFAFLAELTGTDITTSNNNGIWAWSHNELHKVVREGDLFDVDPSPAGEDLRTISSIRFGFSSSGGQDGQAMLLNDNGLLVFSLNFTDGSSGVFTAQLPRLPGDFDLDGDVDGADFVAWQTNFPKISGATRAEGDADGDGDVDGADFVVWQTNFPFTPGPGASPVPEPAAIILALLGGAVVLARRRRA